MLDWVLVLSLRIYSCVVVEGMYTCKTGHFGHKPCCLCLCCSRRYVHTKNVEFLAPTTCVYVYVVEFSIYTCRT